MSPWIPGEMNAVRQQRRNTVKKKKNFLYFHVCAVMCCHTLRLCSVGWQRLSPSLAPRVCLSLLCARMCVCVCVKPVAFCALTSVCLSLRMIPASRACVCVCVCVCARSIRLSVYVYVCVCLCARQMFPGRCHCSVFTHTHIHTLRKINQHFIYPFASWIYPHPPSEPPTILLNPW